MGPGRLSFPVSGAVGRKCSWLGVPRLSSWGQDATRVHRAGGLGSHGAGVFAAARSGAAGPSLDGSRRSAPLASGRHRSWGAVQ